MYKLCKTEQSALRQRQLEQGLLQLMQTKRYEEISISDLCQRMGMPRKTFYRYFDGKDGALFALLDHTMLEFYQHGLREPNAGTAIGDLDRFFVFWHDHASLLSALKRSGLGGVLVERATAFAVNERLMPDHIRAWPAEQQKIALSFALSGLMSMVLQWHEQDFQPSADKMTKMAAAVLTKPLVE